MARGEVNAFCVGRRNILEKHFPGRFFEMVSRFRKGRFGRAAGLFLEIWNASKRLLGGGWNYSLDVWPVPKRFLKGGPVSSFLNAAPIRI